MRYYQACTYRDCQPDRGCHDGQGEQGGHPAPLIEAHRDNPALGRDLQAPT
jgi:hypothetical protein